MLTRKFIATAGICMAGFAAYGQDRPNVILIYTDDQGSLDAGCYGAEDLFTPNIDALAADGVRFTQFYAAPVSSASRAALMTGQFTLHAGLTANAGEKGLPLGKETIADRMHAGGYQTACIGKWHLGSGSGYTPNSRGFDYFWGFLGGCIDSYSHFYYWGGPNVHDLWENGREIYMPGRFFAGESLSHIRSFIKGRDEDRPFFLYWAVNIPHYPLQPGEKWLEYYHDLPSPRNMYAAFVSSFDELLGELRMFLESEGLTEDTVIIFQSDNGHSNEVRTFGSGGYCGDYRGAKFSLFEGGIRVPAIISWPGHIPEGEVRGQMAANVDWFPTLVDLCDVEAENMETDGRSLVPLVMDGDSPAPHDTLHFDFLDQWAVRCGDWKLIHDAQDVKPNDKTDIIEGLFLSNIRLDPTERTDFKDSHPKVVEKLLRIREEYEKSQGHGR